MRRPSVPTWAALAASFVLGAVALKLGSDLLRSPNIADENGQLLASGRLERALLNQLAAQQTSTDPVKVGLSFVNKVGQYCRTFQVRERRVLAGLACNDSGHWKLEVLAPGGAVTDSQYQQAASDIPATVLQAVTDAIDGAPLDAKGEANARDNQWRVHSPAP